MELRTLLAAVALCAVTVPPALGQESVDDAVEVGTTSALRVYLDCDRGCDFDYLRTEIPFVDYVRDRRDAQVHVLVTTQPTGGGGREYTLGLMGREALSSKSDTLRFATRNTDTDFDVRRSLARMLMLGLARYVAGTPAAEGLEISYEAPPEAKASGPAHDPWDHWVFRTRVRGFFEGEQSQDAARLNGSLTASRVTEAWKIGIRASGTYARSRYELAEGETYVSRTRNYSGSVLVARGLGPHWSVGVHGSALSATYVNQDLTLRLGPAVEYNVYPYAESTRRQFSILYAVVGSAMDYEEETIYFKTEERLLNHGLTVSLDVTQPWGSVRTSLEGSQYLQDLAKHRAEIFSDLELRLIKGLSLDVFGSVARIRDQLYLPRGGATPEEVLTRRRQLETSFRYFASVGVSFTFGSIYNNVVNPRFAALGG